MEGEPQEQVFSRMLKFKRKTLLAFAVLCFATSLIFLSSLVLRLFVKPCHGLCDGKSETLTEEMCGGIAMMLFLIGSFTLILCSYKKKTTADAIPHLIPQVVVSEIPLEDLEKSPAPVLSYRYKPFSQQSDADQDQYTNDLLDYLTAVQDKDQSVEETSFKELPGYFTIYYHNYYQERIETSSSQPPDYFTVMQTYEGDQQSRSSDHS